MFVRLRHRLTSTGWRRVRIYIGPDATRLAYRGDVSVRDDESNDEWTPLRNAIFAGAMVVEEVEDVK